MNSFHIRGQCCWWGSPPPLRITSLYLKYPRRYQVADPAVFKIRISISIRISNSIRQYRNSDTYLNFDMQAKTNEIHDKITEYHSQTVINIKNRSISTNGRKLMTVGLVDTKLQVFFTSSPRLSWRISYPRKIEKGAAKMFLHNIKLRYIWHRFYFQLFQVYVGKLRYFGSKLVMLAGAHTKWPPFRDNIVYMHGFSPTDGFICVLHVVLGLEAISNEIITFNSV